MSCVARHFFDSGKFPQASFTATKFRSLGGNRYAADGQLSLHGINKPVTTSRCLDTRRNSGADRPRQQCMRLDFGVGGGQWADTSSSPTPLPSAPRSCSNPLHSGDYRVPPKCTHALGIRQPGQFGTTDRIAQHRHTQAVAGLQRRIVINEHGLKFGGACLCQHIQSQLA